MGGKGEVGDSVPVVIHILNCLNLASEIKKLADAAMHIESLSIVN